MDLLAAMLAHAREDQPNEACGLVVARGEKFRLVRAKNISDSPRTTFDLDPEAWLEVNDDEEVIGVYHSHPQSSAEPSLADLTSCETSGLPWHIVDLEGGYRRIDPSGFVAPLLQRPYVHGVHDCYSCVRDWYNTEWDLGLPDFDRDNEWWNKGQNLYLDNFEKCGFVQLRDAEVRHGDAFLIQVRSKVPNHAAVYIGNEMIIHHPFGRLSTKDYWGGYWRDHATHHLRHNSRMGSSNG